jgi:hypothetical protein
VGGGEPGGGGGEKIGANDQNNQILAVFQQQNKFFQLSEIA